MARFALEAILSVFALMYTLVSLHACAIPPYAPAQMPAHGVPITPGGDRVVVNILQSRPEISLALQQAARMYMDLNPDTIINVHTVEGASEYRVALRKRLLADGRVDVFHVFSGQEARELSAHLEDLSPLPWVSGTMENLTEPVSFGSGVFGIPYSLEATGIIANRNIFEVAGIPLMDVRCFGSLTEAMDELSEMIASGEITQQFPALRNVTDFPIQDRAYLGRVASEILLAGEPSAQATAASNMILPHGEAAEQFFHLMRRHSPTGDWIERDGLSYLYQLESFAAGHTAMLLSDMDGMLRILGLNPDLEGRIELMPIPLPGEGRGGIHTGTPLWWAINANSSDAAKEAAKDFLTWLYTSEQGTTIMAARFGVLSAFPDTAKETGLSIHRQMIFLSEQGHTFAQTWREAPSEWPGAFIDGLRAWYMGVQQWPDILVDLREIWAFANRA